MLLQVLVVPQLHLAQELLHHPGDLAGLLLLHYLNFLLRLLVPVDL